MARSDAARDARDLSELRLGDLQTFIAVQRAGSVNGAAREMSTAASQVSKTVARLEQHLGQRLLSRSSKGVGLTDFGRRSLIEMEQIVERFSTLPRLGEAASVELSVAGESYLLSMCLPTIATSGHPDLLVRGLEMPTSLVRASASEGSFEFALLASDEGGLPPSWETSSIGRVRKGLFGSPRLAKRLGKAPVPTKSLHDVPFVTPIFQAGGRFVSIDDGCPLPLLERPMGHRVQTMQLALDLAAATHQLVFGPAISARLHVQAGSLVEIRVAGWDEHQPLFLAYDAHRVSIRVRNALLRGLRDLFAEAPK